MYSCSLVDCKEEIGKGKPINSDIIWSNLKIEGGYSISHPPERHLKP
jgi:hypothetical protein